MGNLSNVRTESTSARQVAADAVSDAFVSGAGARALRKVTAKATAATEDGYAFARRVVKYVGDVGAVLNLPLPDLPGRTQDFERLALLLRLTMKLHLRFLADVQEELELKNPVLTNVDRTLHDQCARMQELVLLIEQKVVEESVSDTRSVVQMLRGRRAPVRSPEYDALARQVVEQKAERDLEDVDRWAEEIARSVAGCHD